MRSLTTLTTRRWVTGVSVFILLLCQTMAAALAYVATPVAVTASTQSAAADGTPPCHYTKKTGSTAPSNGCHDRCPSRDTTFETAKINIPAAASVASPVFIVDPSHGITAARARYEPIAANAAPPPPLRLVYCRLLN